MKHLIMIVTLLFAGSAIASTLCDELANDPLARGYASMNIEQQAADLNTAYRTKWRECVPGTELLDAIAAADWSAITDAQRDRALSLLAIGCLDPQKNARAMLIRIFGAGTDTIANMANVAQQSISRASELGLSRVRAGEVQKCQ